MMYTIPADFGPYVPLLRLRGRRLSGNRSRNPCQRPLKRAGRCKFESEIFKTRPLFYVLRGHCDDRVWHLAGRSGNRIGKGNQNLFGVCWNWIIQKGKNAAACVCSYRHVPPRSATDIFGDSQREKSTRARRNMSVFRA